jgi:GWxTD domain-containing protein
MMRRHFVAPAIAAAFVVGGVGATWQQGGDQPLTVRAVRFYQPASGTTTIEGVCELRLSALTSGVAGLSYRFEVAVFDSAGLELQRNGWSREVPAAFGRSRGATAMESFGFAAAPGSYRVRLRAVPDSGLAIERDIEIRAFSRRPEISDLILATGAGRAVSDSEAVAPGEVRRAGLAMRSAPVPRLSPTDAALTYYAEVYPWAGAATAGTLDVAVVGEDGRTIVTTPARSVAVEPAGWITRGSVDLAGLPEGTYRLRLRVRLGDSSLVAEAPFRMGGLQALALNTGPSVPEQDLFEGATEERLDSLYAPLEFILDLRTEQGVYTRLSEEGKRRFLREFWRRRDPTPADADNPVMAEFYRWVAFANDAFRQGRAGGVVGWRTDRGRIYLRHGRPDETLRRPVASPRPYEVWKYTQGRPYYYVFYDRNGLGDYALIGTNDRREPGLQEWQRYLGADGAEDVRQFLGLQSFNEVGN